MTCILRQKRQKPGRAAGLTLEIPCLNPSGRAKLCSPRTPFKDAGSPYRPSPLSARSFPSSSSNGRGYCSTSALLKKQTRKKTSTSSLHDVQSWASSGSLPVSSNAPAKINRALLAKLVYEERYVSPSLQEIPIISALQVGPAKAPIFWLFHPSSGFADKYSKYIVDGLPCTVYTISNLYLCHGHRFKSISQMSRIYLNVHIRKVQPLGPYYLGGLGLGGICAREVGALLTTSWQDKQQREKELPSTPVPIPRSRTVSVFLLDSINPTFQPVASDDKQQDIDYAAQSTSTLCPLEQHRLHQQAIFARLLRKHVPAPFRFGAPAALLTAKESKTAPITIHVHLLKAGLLDVPTDGPSPRYNRNSSLTAIHACPSNGWLDASLAPGLHKSTHLLAMTHQQLLGCPEGVLAVNQWLKSKFELPLSIPP